MRPGRALFRVDVSAEIGMGHLMRCLALAEALATRGVDSFFIVGEGEPEHVTLVEERGFSGCRLRVASGGFLDVSFTRAMVRHTKTELCILDGYRFSSSYLRALCKNELVLMALDDLGQRSMPVDLVLNPNVGAEVLSYAGALLTLLGPHFALLRKEFLQSPKQRVARDDGPLRLFLNFGGTDPARATAQLLRLLPRMPLRVTAVVGASYQDSGELAAAAAFAKASGHQVEVLRGVHDMAALMRGSDLAVSAAGGTLLELAYFGVPTLAFAVAPNQTRGGEHLGARGYALYGGVYQERLPCELQAQLTRLLTERERLARAGLFRLIDGQGATRVADAALAMVAQRRAHYSADVTPTHSLNAGRA